MRALLPASLFLISCVSASAQQNNSLNFISSFKIKKLDIKKTNSQSVTLKGIKSIACIDHRIDTMTLGFMQRQVENKKYFIQTRNKFENDITNYINTVTSLSDTNSNLSLLFIINKLWLTDEIRNTILQNSDETKPREFVSGILARIDFVLTDGINYYPLSRFDSVITGNEYIYQFAEEYVGQAIYQSLVKLSSVNLEGIQQRLKKVSLIHLTRYYNERINIEILKDTVYKKGIYKSFNEFKSNKPSITDYEIEFGKTEDMIYEKNKNGSVISARDIWGFCDGTTIYIRSVDNFFPLYKLNTVFYVYGAKSVVRSKQVRMGNFLISPLGAALDKGSKKIVYSIVLKPYQLDLENGTLQ